VIPIEFSVNVFFHGQPSAVEYPGSSAAENPSYVGPDSGLPVHVMEIPD